MSDQILQDYKDYYRTRANRYANDPAYPETHKAEKAMAEAMDACQQLEDFQAKGKELSEASARALMTDEYNMEKKHFDKHQEKVRVEEANQVLQKLPSTSNVNEIISIVSDVSTKVSRSISMDESHRQLINDWASLDEIWIREHAEVPAEYQTEMRESAETMKEEMRGRVNDLEENNSAWEQGWRLQPELIKEYRHRRLVSYNDQHLEEQVSHYQSIINR